MADFENAGWKAIIRGQKAYNGVAVICHSDPDSVRKEFGDGEDDEEARFLAVELNGVTVVNTYVPQGRAVNDPAFAKKLRFYERVRGWLEKNSDPEKRVVWTGDLNVAPGSMDVYDPEKLAGSVCFHHDEQARLARVMEWGLVDLFRRFNPEAREYSFWDYRAPNGFKRNLGWRIDHILVTEALAGVAVNCAIDKEPRGREKPSDHTPVWAEFEL